MKRRYDDTMTPFGAYILAGRIRAYWEKRGVDLDVRVEQASTPGREFICCVRSTGIPIRVPA